MATALGVMTNPNQNNHHTLASGASLDLHVTTLTLSLILTLSSLWLTLTVQSYPNPADVQI